MTFTDTPSIAEFLASRTGRPVAVRAIGWPTFETLPAGGWTWAGDVLRAFGYHLPLGAIMEASDVTPHEPEPQGETVRLFEPAPNQIPGQLTF